MKAKVDQDTCIGCGLCEGIAPDVFRMNDDGKSEAYQEFDESQKELVENAIESCPVSAISMDEE